MIADLLRGFQTQRQKGVEVGGGEMDPTLAVAFDVDHAQDGQGGTVTGHDFGEAAERVVFSSADRQFDGGMMDSWNVDD